MMMNSVTNRYNKQDERPAHRPKNRRRHIKKNEPGVEDLREKLNKKRQEQSHTSEEGSSKVPPPDPAYNFLRDPLRGDELFSSDTRKKHNSTENSGSKRTERKPQGNSASKFDKKDTSGKWWQKQNWKIPSFLREGQHSQDSKDIVEKQPLLKDVAKTVATPPPFKDIANPVAKQPPLNIKVEISFASGERKCTVDATKTLQTATTIQKDSDKPRVRKDPPREAQKYYVSRSKQNTAAPTTNHRQESVVSSDKVESRESHNDNENAQKSSTPVESDNDDNKKDIIEDKDKSCAVSDDTKTENKNDFNSDTENQEVQDAVVSPSKDEIQQDNKKDIIEDKDKSCAVSDDTKTENKNDFNSDTENQEVQDAVVLPSKDEIQTGVSNNEDEPDDKDN